MMRPAATFAVVLFAAGATSGVAASKPKAVSQKEAEAYENSLLSRVSFPPVVPQILYVQPVNKTEGCKLPTTQEQLNRSNFRAYWDGECRNGYAFGLGRDIAISDTHHIEEITIHSGIGDDWSRPRVGYDFVNNAVVHAVGGARFPVVVKLLEKINNVSGAFDVSSEFSVTDERGSTYAIQSSPFSPQKNFYVSQNYGAILFRFQDRTSAPVVNPTAPTFTAEVVDPRVNSAGVLIVRYGNGAVQHFRTANGSTQPVSFPDSYTGHLNAKYQEIVAATSSGSVTLQRAQQIEREYLFKACNGKSGLKGLSNTQYTEICTWRDKFKPLYQSAAANYQSQLAGLRQQAAAAAQQRQMQEQYAAQIALQNRIVQQQENQQTWDMLSQSNQQLQQQTQQILQGVQNWQAPQVQPLTPPNGNKVICNTIGRITTCR